MYISLTSLFSFQFYQHMPDVFRQEFRRLSLDSQSLLDAARDGAEHLVRRASEDNATRSYASRDLAPVVVELYRCGYMEKVRHLHHVADRARYLILAFR